MPVYTFIVVQLEKNYGRRIFPKMIMKNTCFKQLLHELYLEI